MTTQRGIANLTLQINDQVVAYTSGTLEFKGGRGETTLRRQTAGGLAGVNVVTQNIETQKSMVKFTVATTVEAIAQIDSWLLAGLANGNVIRLSGEGVTRSYRNCYVTNDPSYTTGAEGSTEIIFEGDPAD